LHCLTEAIVDRFLEDAPLDGVSSDLGPDDRQHVRRKWEDIPVRQRYSLR